MDLQKVLDELHRERNRLDALIRRIEAGQNASPSAMHASEGRRGRRNMPDAERRAVSKRMKAWWEQRRQAAGSL